MRKNSVSDFRRRGLVVGTVSALALVMGASAVWVLWRKNAWSTPEGASFFSSEPQSSGTVPLKSSNEATLVPQASFSALSASAPPAQPATQEEFEAQAKAFESTSEEFDLVAAAWAFTARNETRAVPLLAQKLRAHHLGQGSLGPSAQGVFLQALGALGRRSPNESHRVQAFEALADTVQRAAHIPNPLGLGDGLLACEALVELGFPGNTERLFGLLEAEKQTLPWPLAERIFLTLEALNAKETQAAAKLLMSYLKNPPNPQFEALTTEESQRIQNLLERALKKP